MQQFRSYQLASRPQGAPSASNFSIMFAPVPSPSQGEALLRTHYLSLDPYMRGRMDNAKSYAAPVEIGQTMPGATIAEVIESRGPGAQVGDIVLAHGGWAEYSVQRIDQLRVLDPVLAPVTTALGVLGMPGFTAYAGLLAIGRPAAGETVAVAAATGPVGSAIGQIAKLKGARTLGIAGGPEKVALLRQFGFDEVIDHRAPDFVERVAEASPNGIDVYFENVGGRVWEAVLPRLNLFARVPVCGLVSAYNGLTSPSPAGAQERLMRTILNKSLTLRGFIQNEFIATMHDDFLQEMSDWVVTGKVKYQEHIIDGFEHVPSAFADMLEGRNTGKTIVRFTQ